jgi:hypothetical protein
VDVETSVVVSSVVVLVEGSAVVGVLLVVPVGTSVVEVEEEEPAVVGSPEEVPGSLVVAVSPGQAIRAVAENRKEAEEVWR